MTSIPLGLAGVFPGHWLADVPFSMSSAIGTVALAGVVIRNSLLIIDFIRDYQRAGRPWKRPYDLPARCASGPSCSPPRPWWWAP